LGVLFLLSTGVAATLWHRPNLAVRAPQMPVVETRELEAAISLPKPLGNANLAILAEAVFRASGRRHRPSPIQGIRALSVMRMIGNRL
jgi:hypothetical protein